MDYTKVGFTVGSEQRIEEKTGAYAVGSLAVAIGMLIFGISFMISWYRF